jgi:hypothetical protein
MAFKSVWGFDPDEVMRAQSLLRVQPDTDECKYYLDEQRTARIHLQVDSQIYELRRMFRLWTSRLAVEMNENGCSSPMCHA